MMTEPKPNLDLLRRVLRQIDEHPETWGQDNYAATTACGTKFCVAGHAMHLLGMSFEWQEDFHGGSFAYWMSNMRRSIPTAAAEVLGLTENESARLFDGDNGRSKIEAIAEEIAARAGEPLWPEG